MPILHLPQYHPTILPRTFLGITLHISPVFPSALPCSFPPPSPSASLCLYAPCLPPCFHLLLADLLHSASPPHQTAPALLHCLPSPSVPYCKAAPKSGVVARAALHTCLVGEGKVEEERKKTKQAIFLVVSLPNPMRTPPRIHWQGEMANREGHR